MRPSSESEIIELPKVWRATLEQTLDNRNGDLTKPDFAGAPPVQTWQFGHRVEKSGEDGLREAWFNGVEGSSVIATFGQYGWWSSIQAEDQLPVPPGL